MKSKLLFTMATTCLAASVAFAQGTPDSGQPSTSAKLPQSTSAGGSTAELGTETAPNGGESTAAISTTAEPAPLGKFTVTLLNETLVNKSSITDKDQNSSGINRIQVGYKLTDTKLISMREDFGFSLARKNDPSRTKNESHFADPFIAYTDTKAATLPGDWVMTAQARYYIPVGESSVMNTKSAGAEALLLVFDKSVGKVDLEFYMLGELYNNTQDYTYAGQADGTFKIKGNPDWVAYPAYGEIAYNFTDKFSILHDMGLISLGYRGGPGLDYARTNIFYNETYLSYQFTKMFSAMLSLEDDAVLESNNAVRPYQDNDTSYNIYLKLKI